ncbi:MAG TPA: hypothetical protein DF715_16950 [Oceanicaulis sp.]|uniref:Beta-lactamase hydrolase-like protein phosphatase-like domain-containing protein n=1 Tax=Glycocaulis albus TaxID=1382801 RepID=A0ABQ1XMV1_9PROT|nr:sulfur transferase domain-containing protein [Glycocaulis albus]MBV5259094.1 hypothetical protein [Synechococcus moorigangaii CMS01]GGG98192.1 hypothetical protein GCM10007420_12470 [Glycocaulis albus]HCY57119.1 hypothetical protein [Oceanicaulis sp.]
MLRSILAATLLTAAPCFHAIAQESRMTPLPGDVRFEARPDATDARSWAREGHTTVINLLTEPEIEALEFDYAGSVMQNGMIYAHVPVGRMTGTEAADAVARIMAETDGPVIINCASATRASHVYAASQIRAGNITRDQLHTIDPEREWNQDLLSRLLGETPGTESAQ